MGPLFATPRTATVYFEVGIAPLTGDSALPLFLYSLVYSLSLFCVSLYPGKLLDTVGNFLAPLKLSRWSSCLLPQLSGRRVLSARRLRLIETLRF
ncbi:branched-chain amino acid transport system II carrier protein [Shigella flexneri]